MLIFFVINFEAWVVKLRWLWDALRKGVLRDGAAAWMVFAKQIRKEKGKSARLDSAA